MRVAPTEPLRDVATKLAFVVDEVVSVLLACFNAPIHSFSRAFTAHEFLLFKICVVLIGLIAIFHSSEVRHVALKAHIIGEFAHCIFLQLAEETIRRVFESLVLLQVFEFRSFHGF